MYPSLVRLWVPWTLNSEVQGLPVWGFRVSGLLGFARSKGLQEFLGLLGFRFRVYGLALLGF